MVPGLTSDHGHFASDSCEHGCCGKEIRTMKTIQKMLDESVSQSPLECFKTDKDPLRYLITAYFVDGVLSAVAEMRERGLIPEDQAIALAREGSQITGEANRRMKSL